jgi:predicted metal-dependent peptidase
MSTTTVTSAHHDALSKAKIQLMARPDSAFFTTVCFSLRHIWDEGISTAGTNGKDIRFNPNFFMKHCKNTEEQMGLLLHETMHVAFQHTMCLDEPGLDHGRANEAMDHVINLMLLERGFKLPEGVCHDPQYKGMHWRQVYALLPIKPRCPSGRDVFSSEGSPEEKAALGREIEDILVRASIQSRMAGDKPGTIPGDIQIFLNGLLNPKLPWPQILRKYLNSFAKSDYSFKKPNRRFFPKHYMPSLYGEALMDLAIGVDISGSVSDSDFHQFVTEIASIFRMMKPKKISVIQFDTEIKSVDEATSFEELMKIEFAGRGGTDVTPVLEWADKNKPGLLLMFTDGGFNFTVNANKNQVLWLIHNNPNFTAPFGKVIHYEV